MKNILLLGPESYFCKNLIKLINEKQYKIYLLSRNLKDIKKLKKIYSGYNIVFLNLNKVSFNEAF